MNHWIERVIAAVADLGANTGHGGELTLRRLVLQLALILVASGIGARFARHVLRQPPVVGQILAGIALGPSLLGAWMPKLHAWLLPADSTALLASLAELGLVLLVFQVGLETDFRKHLQGSGVRAVVLIGLAAFGLPLVVGFFTAPLLVPYIPVAVPDVLGFRLIFACALAITAVPVLARIFAELQIGSSRAAALSIGAAALNDVLGWVVLGGIAAYAHGSWNTFSILTQLGAIVVGLLLVFVLVGPLLGRLVDADLGANAGRLTSRSITWILFVVCIASLVSSTIGVFALIGGLVIGIALHEKRALAAEWERSVAPLVNALFVPLFFTLTGLRTNLGELHGGKSWLVCLAVLLLSMSTKLLSGYAAARACGEEKRVSFAIGVAMNTRGLMELVALNVGLELGVLPRPMFSILVLSALASTYVAAPLLRRTLQLETQKSVAAAAAALATVSIAPPSMP
ncbi:MAG TPA: cation:proton antiporter [Polyangiales bacterium]